MCTLLRGSSTCQRNLLPPSSGSRTSSCGDCLLSIAFIPWRWRHYIPPKHRWPCTGLSASHPRNSTNIRSDRPVNLSSNIGLRNTRRRPLAIFCFFLRQASLSLVPLYLRICRGLPLLRRMQDSVPVFGLAVHLPFDEFPHTYISRFSSLRLCAVLPTSTTCPNFLINIATLVIYYLQSGTGFGDCALIQDGECCWWHVGTVCDVNEACRNSSRCIQSWKLYANTEKKEHMSSFGITP
jgi:hypothetical protein